MLCVLPASCTLHTGLSGLQLPVALAPTPRPPDSSMEDKGTGQDENVLFGRDASNFHSIPHLQYTEFLKNVV